jgi:hypothetical protein
VSKELSVNKKIGVQLGQALFVGTAAAEVVWYQPVEGYILKEGLTRWNTYQNVCINQTCELLRIPHLDPNQNRHFEKYCCILGIGRCHELGFWGCKADEDVN